MGIRKKRTLIPILVVCCLVFGAAIVLPFAREKQSLGKMFEDMILQSLHIHTHKNAQILDQKMQDASYAMEGVEARLRLTTEDPASYLARRNAHDPAYIIDYFSEAQLVAGALETLTDDVAAARAALERGERVVGDIRRAEGSGGAYFLSVFRPLKRNDGVSGVLYVRVGLSEILHEIAESAVYQDVQAFLGDPEGNILFHTRRPDAKGQPLRESLRGIGLSEKEVDEIGRILEAPDTAGNTVFSIRKKQLFAAIDRLPQVGWRLAVFVRGPEVLLHSAQIFQSAFRTGLVAMFLAAAVLFVSVLLQASRRNLEKEQERTAALTHRLQAMFAQHSALKVVFSRDGKVLDANPALLRHFGYSKEELVGCHMSELSLLPFCAQQRQGEEMFVAAAPYRLKNGELRFMDVHTCAVADEENQMSYAILFDVTDREVLRKELLQEKELLETTLQAIGDGVATTDNRGILTSLNSVAEELTGWKSKEAVGRPFTEVFVLRSEETGLPVENPIQRVLETGLIVGPANHAELVNRRGLCVPIVDSAAPIQTETGQTFGVVMVFRDVSKDKENHKAIEFLSRHDPLTGLYNRRYIGEVMHRLEAPENQPLAVIMGDVNGLKITNDVFGHRAGDALLKRVAQLLRGTCRAEDLIARWGGDEFVVFMPQTTLREAEEIAGEIQRAQIPIGGSGLRLSLSLGCAGKEGAEKPIQEAMQEAEEAMYHQKLLDSKSYRNSIINTLLATLYEKSFETEEHSKRMERVCHVIGSKLGLSAKEMNELSLLALLHDIGKATIDPNILLKPGPLTPEEWDEMKRHPEIGYRIAQATPELTVVADLILSHHERWDGKGYPHGLREKEIPLACRILAVSDAFDAMTHNRVYRGARSQEEAVAEIRKNAGTQFDPEIVELFVNAL